MDIVEFLRARLDEDEAIALAVPENQRGWEVVEGAAYDTWTMDDQLVTTEWRRHWCQHDPARVLRDVHVKRRIIDWCVDRGYMGPVIQLAAAFDQHPDYGPEWTP